jgi:hypothetical protein
MDAAATRAATGPLGHISNGLACLQNVSPFAFANPGLEKQYQTYQSAYMGSHVGTMCWSMALSVAVIVFFAWRQSMDDFHVWRLTIPIALCLGGGFFSRYAPGTFRKHWQTCCFVIRTVLVVLDNDIHTFCVSQHIPSGKLPSRTLLEHEFYRLLSFTFFAVGFPLSLPAWGFAHIPLFFTPAFSLAAKYQSFKEFECPPIPWPVTVFMHSMVTTFAGNGPHVSRVAMCRVGVVFWKVQTEMMGALNCVLIDVAWRRAFLRAHPHLLGHSGAARADVWPFGSPRTALTCTYLLVWLIFIDVMAVDIWVSGIVGEDG